MIPLPGYIDAEAWAGFVEMRRSMGKTKPFTTRAATLILYQLQKIKDAGHCPNAALDQSTLRGWADVWPAKEKEILKAQQAESTTQYVERMKREAEAEKARCAPPPSNIRELISRVGR